MIDKILYFHNQMLMVFDENGEQISKYQGKINEKYKLILKDASKTSKFYLAIWGYSEKQLPIEALKEYAEMNLYDIRKYLDKCIRFWRNKLKKSKNKENKLIAECNIDTYQSVRKSIIGELLPKPKPDPKLISYIEKGYIPRWFAIILAILLLIFIISIFTQNI